MTSGRSNHTSGTSRNKDDEDERMIRSHCSPSATTITMASPNSVSALKHVQAKERHVEPLLLTPPSTSSCVPWMVLTPSKKSLRTTNPIRNIVDPIFSSIQNGCDRLDGKDPISLALGDPTASGNLPPCPVALEAVAEALHSSTHAAGYVPACGCPRARQAVAEFHTHQMIQRNKSPSSSSSSSSSSVAAHTVTPAVSPVPRIDSDHVIIASGCSGALELALTALLDDTPDSVLLVPLPGFPLYGVIAESHGARTISYPLDCHNNWQVDLTKLELLLQRHGPHVRGIVINNPSNPTGDVYSRSHLCELVEMCQQYRIPIVADEVYGDLVLDEDHNEFVPLAQVAYDMGQIVPVITASGIGKQFLLPGWRVGWIVFHDNIYGSLQDIEAGAKRLAQVILGASHLPQTSIPALLSQSDPRVMEWKYQLRQTLQHQAHVLCRALQDAPGLHVVQPRGAMYTMIQIDSTTLDVSDDIEFAQLLLHEENVIVLPGSCFGMSHYIRVVFCAPSEVLLEAAFRIVQFCERHQCTVPKQPPRAFKP